MGYQNNMLHLFNNNYNFKLIVTEEGPKIRNKILNYIYGFIQSIRFIHILFNYLYLTTQVIMFRKKVDYLFIAHHFKYGLFAILMSSLFRIPFIVPILGWAEKELMLKGISNIELFVRLKYEYWVLKKAKCILSPYDLTNKYVKVLKNRNKFLNIDSPIDTNRFKPMPKSEIWRDKLGLANKNIIFTAAPLWGTKGEGIKILLKAFVLLKRTCGDVILLIA